MIKTSSSASVSARSFGGLFLAFYLAFSATGPAQATSVVQIFPGSATQPSAVQSGVGLQALDSGAVAFAHGTFNARASADDSTGVLRSFASSTQTQGATQTNPILAQGASSLSGMVTLVGPGAAPIPIIVSMDFGGNFTGSNAFNDLAGQIIGVSGSSSWTSALDFLQFGSTNTILTSSLSSKSLPGDFDNFFLAGTPIITSTAAASLHGRVLMPIALTPGQSLTLTVSLIARSGAYQSDGISYSGTFDGIADGFSTGRMLFTLPAGYSFAGAGGVFAGVPVTVVPEPSIFILMLIGFAVLAAFARFKRDSSIHRAPSPCV